MPTLTTAPTFNPLAIIAPVLLESLTISRDAMPHHYIARAVILDLAPSQMVAAIMATEDAIKQTYPRAVRTGWSAKSDGLTIYFYAWTAVASWKAAA
jgi:hypothetical protein